MIELSTCNLRYRYGHADKISADIRYRYVENVASTTTADLVYRWTRDADTPRVQRQFGFWADSTQELGNLFPHWHMARHNPGGNTQLLLNAWGMGLDDAKANYTSYRRQLFINTADLTEPDVFKYAATLDQRSLTRDRSKNMLLNPSFSILGLARTKMPIHWCRDTSDTTGTVEAVSTPSYLGSYSVKLSAEAGELCHLDQRQALTIHKGQPITASIWYRNEDEFDTIEADTSIAKLALYVVYADGTMEVTKAPLLLGTASIWRRASCSVVAAKTIAFVDFVVQIDNKTEDLIEIFVSGAQLEKAQRATKWDDAKLKIAPYLRETEIEEPQFEAYLQSETGIRKLTFLSSTEDLWYGLPPSRATLTETIDVPSATQRTTLGWLALKEGDPAFTTDWRITNNKIERFNRQLSHEVFGSFDIAEFWLDGRYNELVGIMTSDEDSGFSRTLETLCVYQNLLWVVCLETYHGDTIRVLKILNPRSLVVNPNAYSAGLDMHLECMGDIALGIDSDSVTYLGVIDSDAQRMLVTIGGTYYTISFEYDYYSYERSHGQVIIRTPSAASLITV